MSHDHRHLEADSGDKRVAIAIWANGLLTVAQIVGGILSGSLALIADAIHNFSDMASLVIAFGARKIARRPADAKMTFGYGRVEIVAALINYTSLIVIGFYLVYEGAMRFADPPQIEGWTVVILGCVALVVDTLTALLTFSMQKGSMNIRALFLHNLSDALASVAVIVGGVLILSYDTAVESVEGVKEVHHVHFWQMQEHQAALDTHVVIEDARWDDLDRIKEAIKARLDDEFSIDHSTLEFEREDNRHEGADRFGHG